MKATLETTRPHLQARLSWYMIGNETPEIIIQARLWDWVDLGKRFADLSALYGKIHSLLSWSNGTPPLDFLVATTHIAIELKQWNNIHMVVDAWNLWYKQKFYAGNVWIGPELAGYRTLDPADLPSSRDLPELAEWDQEKYRIMTWASYANAIIHTVSWKVLELHPLDIIVQQYDREIDGRPVSLVVSERMEKFVARMRSIVRD